MTFLEFVVHPTYPHDARRAAKTLGEKVIAPDTHRNELAEVKTFLKWCSDQNLISKSLITNLGKIIGKGKRSKGKEQLRVDEARRWMAKALEMAPKEPGAVAALCCFVLGMRSSEVISRVARDLDDRGRLLWIPDAKTEAGRRCLEVPEILQPYLLRLRLGKHSNDLLFGHHWRDWPRKWVRKICQRARVPLVSAHGMRGLHATLAIQAGTSAHSVAASLGHAHPSVTEEYYAKREAGDSVKQKKVPYRGKSHFVAIHNPSWI